MRIRGITLAIVVAVSGAAMVSCGAPEDQPRVSCHEVLDRASYEVMSQLAHEGFVADPVAVREALPEEFRQVADALDDPVMDVPSYKVFIADFDDSEQATFLSALRSKQHGVGAVFDQEAFYTSGLDAEGCANES